MTTLPSMPWYCRLLTALAQCFIVPGLLLSYVAGALYRRHDKRAQRQKRELIDELRKMQPRRKPSINSAGDVVEVSVSDRQPVEQALDVYLSLIGHPTEAAR